MDYVKAVVSQPETLASARGAVDETLRSLDLGRWAGGSLAVVGMGASTHAAHALVHELAGTGRRILNVSATDLLDHPVTEPADCYLVVSESGRSRETIEAARGLRGPRLGLTNDPQGPLTAVVDEVVPMGGFEDSPVYTVGYTATLQAFGLLSPLLGAVDTDSWSDIGDEIREELDLATSFVERVTDAVEGARCVDVVGRRSRLASAAETGLLLREAARVPSATYDTYQYLHGPMEPLGPGLVCLVFGDDREVELARFVAGTGATAVLLTTQQVPEEDGLVVHRLPVRRPCLSAVREIVSMQLLVARLAERASLAIDGFRYEQSDTKVR